MGARRTGPLALVGSGEFLPVMEDVDRELLHGRPQRAVFLPTAAAPEGEQSVARWIDMGTEHYRRIGVDAIPLRVLDRSDANDDRLAALIDGAGLVYLSGGNPGYLADTLRRTVVGRAIRDAWRSGAAVAGCSAGASALTAIAHEVAEPGFPVRVGLRFAPHIAVLPHFDRIERWVGGIAQRALGEIGEGMTLIGIDEETALVGGPSRWNVRGSGRVWVIPQTGERVAYLSGSHVRLPAR